MSLDQNRLKTGLLLAGAIGFAALAQYYFFYRRQYVWDGAIFCGVALLCFARLLRQGGKRKADKIEIAFDFVSRWRALLAGLALSLNLIAARSANAQSPPASYAFSVLLWLASLALFFAAFVHYPLALTRSTFRLDRNKLLGLRLKSQRATLASPELIAVFCLLLAGLLLRAWDLGHIPANFSGDEGSQGLWAVSVLEGQVRNPFTTGWFTVPTMSFFAQAASLRLFGDSVAGLRTLSALVGTATLIFTYLLARQELGRRVAVFALAALTFNHYHIHFSRLGSNQIADPFFMALTLWLLTKGLKETGDTDVHTLPPNTHNTLPWLLAAGLTMGLSWYGYFGSRVIMLVVSAYLGMRAMTERDFLRRHAFALTLMVLITLMVASPLLLYYKSHPENLTARFNQVSFFRWLDLARSFPDHDSTLVMVLRQTWLSISAFNHTLDPTFWYRAQIPLLDFVSGIFFILGLAVAINQWRQPAIRLALAWFGLALTFGWILTENPPSSMRMVIIAPAVALLVGLGLDRLLTLMQRGVGGRRVFWTRVGLLLVAAIALLNVHYYFVTYTPTRIYGNRSAETSTDLARYLAGRDDQPFVYFYGPPVLYYDFGAIRFIARDVPGTNVSPGDQAPDFPPPTSGPALFIVLGERLNELDAIRAQHQGGRLYEFHSKANGRLMFVVYEVWH